VREHLDLAAVEPHTAALLADVDDDLIERALSELAVAARALKPRTLLRGALRIELGAARSWELGNASVNRLLHTPRGFSLVGWSDTAHLEGETPLDDESEGGGRVAAVSPAIRS